MPEVDFENTEAFFFQKPNISNETIFSRFKIKSSTQWSLMKTLKLKHSEYKNLATKTYSSYCGQISFRDKKVCPEVTATDTSVLMETADLISAFKKLSISVNQRGTRQSELERDSVS